MTKNYEDRLQALGITLAAAPIAVADYVPVIEDKGLLFISGQIPVKDGAVVYQGQLGESVSLETGVEAARLCAINILAQLKGYLGDLSRVERCIRLGGFVSASANFHDHAKVINGASQLMVQVFGDAGRHARAAIGCSSLPLNSAVEVEALFRVTE